ncbi:CotH kinase family protein [Acidipila sp. EB88]|uniref:CotH kinase family protein n=1 Tax=Acidipila sp. EB88 TaxID=2305226 RepID=UPI0013156D53|nr:CotH kinase family protein [Acidipila sp. EB88]
MPAQSNLTIYPGSAQTLAVTVPGTGPTPVTIGLSGLPSGITVTSEPATVLPGASAVLTLTAATNADAEAFPSTVLPGPGSATTNVTVNATAGSVTATATVALVVSLSNAAFSPAAGQTDLPVLRIDTGNVPVTSTETDVSGTVTITSADGSTSLLPGSGDSDNTATFHVHGNTTSVMPKLPYTMKLGTSVDLLGLLGVQCPYVTSSGKAICDKSKSYVLLANYDDKSLLRDWAASYLANAIPYGDGSNGYLAEAAGSPTPSGTSTLMPWAPHSAFVELYLNGQYEGNYQLIEKVNVDSHRVNIPELTEQDTTGDLTGGYLMEIDAHEDEAFVFVTPHNLPIGLIDPDFTPDPEVAAQTAYISQYVDTAENAMFSSSYTDPTQGWRAYFDEAALVNYYIVTDVMGNVDGGAFYSSVYLYKSVDNPLLYMGPAWDFDISAGNVNYQPIVNPTVPWTQTESPWYRQLFTDPGFVADVRQQWNTMKSNGILSDWVTSIDQQGTMLTQSAQNNFARWPMLGETVWPNASAQTTYADSVAALTDWINLRIGYLDSELNQQPQSAIKLTAQPAEAAKGGAITYSIAVSSHAEVPTGKVTLYLSGHAAGTAELDAAGQARITVTAPSSGKLHPMVVYGGDTHHAIAQLFAR